MPRRVAWLVIVLPLVGAGGCQVDSRTVICDSACEQGIERTGGAGGVGSGTGGASVTGGTKATGGAASGGSSSGGAKASGGATSAGGAAGKGGSNGVGGNAAAGASGAVADCNTNAAATGTNPLISDFESDGLSLIPNEGRAGYWTHLRSDTQPTPSASPLILAEGGNKFLRFSGAGIEAAMDFPWVILKTDLKGIGDAVTPRSCAYDASVYRGIEFRARGVEVRVSVEMDLNVPVSNTFGAPGACTAADPVDCYDRHNAKFTLSATWGVHRLYWEDLAQQGYGDWHPVFDPARLLGLYFEVIQDPMSASIPDYQIDVDDVVFLP